MLDKASIIDIPAVGTISLWEADLDKISVESSILSVEERHRSSAFRTAELSHRFSAGRCFLRHVLGGYVDRRPEDIRLSYNRFGKPRLHDQAINFNVSHTGADIIIGLSENDIGVDLERIESFMDNDGLAAEVMSPGELLEFKRMNSESRPIAFSQLWTAKEALLKCLGTGLSRNARELHLGWASKVFLEAGDSYHISQWSYREGLSAAAVLKR